MTSINNLPPELRKSGLFCLWKYEYQAGRQTKVPYNPLTGGRARPNDEATFAPLTVAEALQSKYDGLGVGIFGELCAIDIDHCIDDSGAFSAMATDIISTMNSYTEFSPSGTGIHVLFRAVGLAYNKTKYYINNQKLGLEVYVAGATNKYVTVTGNAVLEGCSIEERSTELQSVLDKYMLRPSKEQKLVQITAPPAVDLFDAELIARAKRAGNGDVFSSLLAGDFSGYKSHSEADLAFCNLLAFWTCKNAVQMDQIFRTSRLMREKWDRPQAGTTYGALTIQKAIEECRTVYNPQEHFQKRAFNIQMVAERVNMYLLRCTPIKTNVTAGMTWETGTCLQTGIKTWRDMSPRGRSGLYLMAGYGSLIPATCL